MTIRSLILIAPLLGAVPALAEGWTVKLPTLAVDAGSKDERRGPPPQLNPLSGPQVPLSRKERRGVAYGRQWTDNADMLARGEDGGVVFVFGATADGRLCAALCLRSHLAIG